jgi:acylphosphatase
MSTAAIHLRIEGRVQGVCFRAWVVDEAQRRGLRGWVRNRRDGSVETLLIGDEPLVEDMVDACRQGPPLASVSRVERQAGQDDGTKEFRQLPTA